MYAQNYTAQATSTMTNAFILYIGQPEKGKAFAEKVESNGGYVYLPENLMQALGMYITYMPQVVVIDMTTDYAHDFYDHLRSVDARPLVLLTYHPAREAGVYTLPSHISAEALMDALGRFVEPQRVPNGLYQYA